MNARKVGRILDRMLVEGETLWPAACVWWAAWHLRRATLAEGAGEDDTVRVRVLWALIRAHAPLRLVAFLLVEQLESRARLLGPLAGECRDALEDASRAEWRARARRQEAHAWLLEVDPARAEQAFDEVDDLDARLWGFDAGLWAPTAQDWLRAEAAEGRLRELERGPR